MDANWDKSCIEDSVEDVDYMTSLGLESNLKQTANEKVFYYSRGLKDVKPDTTVLVLLHGYPQTGFMWRHVVPLLPKDIPLFIPDLPGYGRSSPLPVGHSKRNMGNTLLTTLHSILRDTQKPQSIILAGHDRGARICHRLTVDAPSLPSFHLKGTILLDIMPGPAQWATGATPSKSVGFYHWSFLPNVDLATEMIMAFGGGKYVERNVERWLGTNKKGVEKLKENNSLGVYGGAFGYEHVVKGSCDDYRASAFEEIEEHEGDQKEGRKMDVDVLLCYSATFLGSRGKIEVWDEWMGKGKLEKKGFGDGIGHFVAEEAPELTAEAIGGFYKDHA